MQEEAADAFIADCERKEALIAGGKLPDVPGVWNRFAYIGHEVLNGYVNAKDEYRCVTCMGDFALVPDMHRTVDCPTCGPSGEVYQTNINRSSRWRCVSCKHEWDGDVGWKCPSPKCGVIKNAPRWYCPDTTCAVEWYGENGKFCPKCGKSVKYDKS